MVIYHLQTKLGIELPQEVIHDIHSNFYQAIMEECERAREREQSWYNSYIQLRDKGFPLKWNELRIKLARMKTEESEAILELMMRLDDAQHIRDLAWVKK
jgi:hypothetical protein